jgi:type I restriction enzyme S subunit
MSLPRYLTYKDSGVEWLGKVPEQWTVISIKWLSPVKRGASPRPIDDEKYFDDEGEFAWVRIADVSASDGVLVDTTQRLSHLGSSLSVKIAPGELFVSIAGTVGKPCISAIRACIHDGFVYFPTLKIDPKFLYRIFEGGGCYGGLGKWGTQLNLNTDTIGSIRVAVPPPSEMKHLLAFLDLETAKIDALVAEQQLLIELLKEKRQAVISHAVTKGLNSDAPMKDSGVEWLGEVPAHWEVKVIKRFSTLQRGHDLTDTERTEGSYPVVTSGGISGTHGSFMARGPGVVTGRYGSTGRLFYIEGDFWPHNTSLYVSNFHKNLPRFVWYSLQTVDFAAHSAKAAVPGIDRNDIHVLPAVVPPISEQSEIVTYLDATTTKVDLLTTEAQRAIDLLQERRTALISAAVTGQIDVRPAAERASA